MEGERTADPKVKVVIEAVNNAKGEMDETSYEAERMGGRMKAAGMAVAAAGAAITAAIIKSTESIKQFNRTIEETAVTAGASSKDIDRLKESAMDIGNALIPAEEVSKGYGQLMRITHDAAEAMAYMNSFVELSMATQTDLTANIADVTDVMAQMGLAMEDTSTIMDNAVAIYSNSSWSINDVFNAMNQVGPAALTAGMSFDELSSILGVMAQSGMSVSSATAGISIMMGRLVDDAEETVSAFRELDVQTHKADGTMRGMTDILGDVADKFEAMENSTDKTRIAVELFGARSGPKMGLLLSQGSQALVDFQVELEGAEGKTKALSKVAEDSITPWDDFKNTLHEVSLKFGAIIEPVSGVLAGLSSLLMPLGMMMMMYPRLAGGMNKFSLSNIKLAAASLKATISQWLHNIAMYANPIVWIIAAIIALIAILVLLVKNWDKVTKAIGKFAGWVKGKLKAVGGFIKGAAKKWVEAHKKAFGAIKDAAGKAWDGLKKTAGALKGWARDKFAKWFDVSKKFFAIGKKLMESLKKGMEAMKNKLKDAAKGIADKIKSFFGGSLPEAGPLVHIVQMGEDLMRGYAKGMARGSGVAQRELIGALRGIQGGGVTRNYQPTFNVNVGGGADTSTIRDIRRKMALMEEHYARMAGE